ncbi:MAG TPA: Uma2 family endonuclease, partial [Pseudonocardia sp.]|nr:Uma2 family endonuclease [Pseudonocardia sp.]
MVIEHEGPWGEQDFLALDVDDRRVELLDGSLLVSPTDGGRRQQTADRLRAALEAVLPEPLAVAGPVLLRTAPGRVVQPDLVVGRPGT